MAPATYASRIVLPLSLQGSLPAGWLSLYREGVEPSGSLQKVSRSSILLLAGLAFTGRASNPLDRCKRFQDHPSSFSGLSLAQGKFHFGVHVCNSHNGLHCLPALNGATGSLGNFPECLTGRTSMLALADDAALARLAIAAAQRRARLPPSKLWIARSRACPRGLGYAR